MKLLLLIMAFSVCALSQNTTTTNGLANGRLWKSIQTNSAKSGFLFGYSNGVTYGALSALFDGQPVTAERADSIDHLQKRLFPSTMTLEEVAASLDSFYDPPENAPITIASALEVISARASGADESTIRRIISGLLKNLTN